MVANKQEMQTKSNLLSQELKVKQQRKNGKCNIEIGGIKQASRQALYRLLFLLLQGD